MKPLNQAERKKAFLNFLLFFIITMAVVITAVFFSMQVPFRENKKMKEQVIAYQNNDAFAAQFFVKTKYIESLIDKLGTPDTQTDLLYTQINSLISDLQVQKDKTISDTNNIYSTTIHALYDLGSYKSSLVKSGGQSQDLGRLQQDKESLMQRINDANNYIIQLSASVKMPQPWRSF